MNNKYKQAFDAVQPSEQKKQEIINKLMQPKKAKKRFVWHVSAAASFAAVILIFCAVVFPMLFAKGGNKTAPDADNDYAESVKNEYNAVLLDGYAIETDKDIFIIRSKSQLDEVYTEEIKTAYKEKNQRDFDNDFPFGQIDFDSRMLILYFYPADTTGETVQLEGISISQKQMQITFTTAGKASNEPRCIAIEMNKLDIDRVVFEQG